MFVFRFQTQTNHQQTNNITHLFPFLNILQAYTGTQHIRTYIYNVQPKVHTLTAQKTHKYSYSHKYFHKYKHLTINTLQLFSQFSQNFTKFSHKIFGLFKKSLYLCIIKMRETQQRRYFDSSLTLRTNTVYMQLQHITYIYGHNITDRSQD